MIKRLIWVFFLHTMLGQGLEQKMILSAYLKTADAAKDLYRVEKFFQENEKAKALQSKHHLTLQMELLDPYVVVSIKAIVGNSVKNNLHYLLKEKFPQSFVVDDTPMRNPVSVKKVTKEAVATPTVKSEGMFLDRAAQKSETKIFNQVKLFWKELDNEWIALFLLALAGFLLIYRSTRQISKIKALQKKVEVYQNKIGNDIEDMGVEND